MTSGIKSRIYSVQIRRIDVQTMIGFVKIEQVEPNILKWKPFRKRKIESKRSPFESSPRGCVSNNPVLLICFYAVFIAFAFSFDDYSVSFRLKHVLVTNFQLSRSQFRIAFKVRFKDVRANCLCATLLRR